MVICSCGVETSRVFEKCANCGELTRNAREICGGCGAETRYITVKATRDGKPLAKPIEECPECNGTRDRIRSVTDRKLWQGHEAYAEHYKKQESDDGSVTYVASDSMIQDLVDEWSKDPDAEERKRALEMKRANRRTRPMSKGEIESAVNMIAEEVEQARRVNAALDAGLLVPDTI